MLRMPGGALIHLEEAVVEVAALLDVVHVDGGLVVDLPVLVEVVGVGHAHRRRETRRRERDGVHDGAGRLWVVYIKSQ